MSRPISRIFFVGFWENAHTQHRTKFDVYSVTHFGDTHADPDAHGHQIVHCRYVNKMAPTSLSIGLNNPWHDLVYYIDHAEY